jgi:hypothetical protein
VRGTVPRLLLLAALAWGGVHLYRTALAPDPDWLTHLAERELAAVFGSGTRSEAIRIDLVDGIEVRGLTVATRRTPRPTLAAARVEVRHELLDLMAGLHRTRRIVIEGADVTLRETPGGVVQDFPLRLTPPQRGAPATEVVVTDSRVSVRARPGSTRLAAGRVLRLADLELHAVPGPDGRLAIRGGFATRGLGQDATRLALDGWADAATDALEVHVVWDPLALEPELLDTLAADLAAPLRGSPLEAGRLEVTLTREPRALGEARGELLVSARWLSAMNADVAELPGLRELPADERARLAELLGGGALDVQWERGALLVRGLTARLGTGSVTAKGRIEQGGEALELEILVRGLSLEDPALRRALGEQGEDLFRQMEARGSVDADITLTKIRGGALTWHATVTLVDATLIYRGNVDAEGRGDGFPYALEHANGVVRLSPAGVIVDGIEGRHGERTVMRILSSKRPSWTGEESGYVRFTDAGPDLCLTLEALDVPVDEDLRRAVDGSEVRGVLDKYRLGGVIDRAEADIVRHPALDPAARVEVRLTLDQETFAWNEFPVPLHDVRGIVMLRRPALPAPGREKDPEAPAVRRGRVVLVDLRGALAQPGEPAAVSVRLDVQQHDARGRVHLTAKDVAVEGPLGRMLRDAPLTAGGVGQAVRWLDPRGRADVEGDFPIEKDPGPIRVTAVLRGVGVTVDAPAGAPRLDLEGLTGTVEAVGSSVRFTGLKGRFLGAALALDGRFADGTDGPWSLDVKTSEPLPLTPDLLERVETLSACSTLLPAGMRLEPGGRAGLEMRVEQVAGADCVGLTRLVLTDVDATVALAGGPSMRLQGKSFALDGGDMLAKDLTVVLPGASVRVGEGRFGTAGLVGRFHLVLDRLRMDEEVLSLVPEDSRADVREWTDQRRLNARALTVVVDRAGGISATGDLAFVADEDAPAGGAPRGEVALHDLKLGPPDPLGQRTVSGTATLARFAIDLGLDWTELVGRVEVDRLRLGDDPSGAARLVGLAGRVEGIRFKDFNAPLQWSDGLLRIEPMTGALSGGSFAARLLMHTRAPEAFEGRIEVRGFDLARLREDLAPTGAPYRGTGALELEFSNRTSKSEDLLAKGTLRVRDGHLGDLPVVSNLFLAIASTLPGHTPPSFESLDAEFALRDRVLHFQHLDLAGPLTKMPGRGTADLTGHVDLTFTPDFLKGMLLPGLMGLPGIGDVLRGALSEELLYAVRIRGDLDQASTEIVPLPPLGIRRATPFDSPPPPEPPRRRLPRSFR